MIVYDTGHMASATVCRILASGFGCDLQPAPWKRPLRTPAAFYGRDRGTLVIKRQCEADGVPWFFADNGYLGRAQFDGYYKITRNGFQCDGRGEPDERRLAAVLDRLGWTIKPWREPRKKGHILLCPPIPEYAKLHWFDVVQWLRQVRREIKMNSQRPIRLRHKPGLSAARGQRSVWDDLEGCYAVVTHDSNIVVEAIAAGVPCFVTGASPAEAFGNTDLETIEEPRLGDQAEWLAILAANQWTLDEIRDGMANDKLGIV